MPGTDSDSISETVDDAVEIVQKDGDIYQRLMNPNSVMDIWSLVYL
jgi:hypothetical protein